MKEVVMTKIPIAQSVMNLIEPVLVDQGLELTDVEYKKEGKDWVLRVFIDKEEGITVEDCRKISHLTGDLIEIEEIIQTPFNLEVSSPGLDRSLKREKDFVKFKGKRIRLHSLAPIDSRRKFIGILSDFKDQTVFMDLDGKPFKILLSQVAKANLVIEI
jgi:ribosome maturation factor RimP